VGGCKTLPYNANMQPDKVVAGFIPALRVVVVPGGIAIGEGIKPSPTTLICNRAK